MESCDGSYGWSLDGISRMAGMGRVKASRRWRMLVAIWHRMKRRIWEVGKRRGGDQREECNLMGSA